MSSSSHQALPSLLQRTLRLLLLRSPLSQAAKEVLREGGVNKLHKPRDLVALGVEVQQDHVLVAIRPDDRVRLAAAPDGDGVGGVVLDDGLDRWREVLEERHDAAEVRAELGVGLLGAVEGAWVGVSVSGLGWEGDEGGFKAYTRGRLGKWWGLILGTIWWMQSSVRQAMIRSMSHAPKALIASMATSRRFDMAMVSAWLCAYECMLSWFARQILDLANIRPALVCQYYETQDGGLSTIQDDGARPPDCN